MCRVNEYRALASPSLMALSSSDPILNAFQLSWELRRLGTIEKEFTNEYMVKTFSFYLKTKYSDRKNYTCETYKYNNIHIINYNY